jgi:hypothetical protein
VRTAWVVKALEIRCEYTVGHVATAETTPSGLFNSTPDITLGIDSMSHLPESEVMYALTHKLQHLYKFEVMGNDNLHHSEDEDAADGNVSKELQELDTEFFATIRQAYSELMNAPGTSTYLKACEKYLQGDLDGFTEDLRKAIEESHTAQERDEESKKSETKPADNAKKED